MPLKTSRELAAWGMTVLFSVFLSACEAVRTPVPPGPEPITPPAQAGLFQSEDMSLAFSYPARFSVEQSPVGSGQQVTLISPFGSRLEFEVKALARTIDLQTLGQALVSVDQSQLAVQKGAHDFSSFREVSFSGRQALRYDFRLGGLSGARMLMPVEQRMYTATQLVAAHDENRIFDAILDSVRIGPVHLGEAPAGQALPSAEVPHAAASIPPPSAGLDENDILAMLWSFCPHQSNRAGIAIFAQLQRDPSGSPWISLDVEQKTLQTIIARQQGRQASNQDFDKLVQQARGAAQGPAASEQARRALGLALLLKGEMSESRTTLDRALSMNDQKPLTLLALALWHGPVAADVEPLLAQAESLDASIPAIWLIRAWLAQLRNDRNTAAASFRRAVDLDSRNTATLIGLGRLEMDDPNTRIQAAERFGQVLAVNPADDVALYNLALIRMREGDNAQALVFVQQLVDSHPGDAPAWNLRGQILRARGQFQDAAESHRRALEQDPNLAQAFFNLGVLCAEDLSDVACARRAFSEFLRLEPDGPRSRQVLEWISRN